LYNSIHLDPQQAKVGQDGGSNDSDNTTAKGGFSSFGFFEWPQQEPPEWLTGLHSLVVGSVQKGIKSSFKKSIQESIVASFSICISALNAQILAP
jgi:hypothetical protein